MTPYLNTHRKRRLHLEPLEQRQLLAAVGGGVVINEIMYHPASALVEPAAAGNFEPTSLEFVELLNNDVQAIDLGGWSFNRGVSFTFPPQTTLQAGEFLVVAADLAAFQQRYPGVTNVVGGWQGRLNNTTERIRLIDAAGETIDQVRYADQGDWAIRRLEQDPVTVNGVFFGWKWFAAHDGDGFSLSLRNPDLPNDAGQNWAASSQMGGTPGFSNEDVVTNNVPPLILDLEHVPAIPRTDEPVIVSVRIVDELPENLGVVVRHRVGGAPIFQSTTMIDSGDGLYVAELPGRPNGTVVEFYIEANDGIQQSTWPRPDNFDQQIINALYQVDDSVTGDFAEPWPLAQPIYRIVLTPQGRLDLTALEQANGRNSKINAQVHGTFIALNPDRGIDILDGDVVQIDPGGLSDFARGTFGDAEVTVLFPEDLFEGNENINAVHVLSSGSIVFSTSSSARLAGSDLRFGNGDLVLYDPATGEASLYLSERIFDSGSEDIDAVYIDERDGSIILSTNSGASLGPLNFANGDLIKITPNSRTTDFVAGQLGDAVVTRIFSETLFASGANIDAVSVLANGHLAISTTNDEVLAGTAFGPGDVIEYDPGDEERDPTVSVIFAAATFARDNEDVDALFTTVAGGPLAISTDGGAQLGTDPRVRYNAGIRIRGNGTRSATPKNYRVEIPSDRMFSGGTSLNLNSQFSHAARLGTELFREAGLVRETIDAIQFRINGTNPAVGSGSTLPGLVNYGSYVEVEAVTGQWADDHIPLDSEGNYYRQIGEANLEDVFATASDYKLSADYSKSTNSSQDDWNDLVSLAAALNIPPSSENYLDEIVQVVNVNQWLRHMAVQALLANNEGGIGTMRGDDTALYRGAIDTRFIIAPHDLDTSLGFSNSNVNQLIIHRRNNTYTNLSNLVTHPALYPLLYGHIEELLATFFNPETMNPLIDRVYGEGDGDWISTVQINIVKQFVVTRAAVIRAEMDRDAIIPVSPHNLIDLPEQYRYLADQQQWLRVSEIMFNPDGDDELEFIELVNMAPVGSAPLDLRGVHFTDGILFGFVEDTPIPSSAAGASVLELAPGERTLVVKNRQAFLDRYDPDRTNVELQNRIAGEFGAGRLSNAGEQIRLEGRLGEPILEFSYKDSWFARTDGGGFSLVLRDEIDASTDRAAWGNKSTWRASQFVGGAPGERDGGLNPNSIVINEILTHTDAAAAGDWIELLNTTTEPIDISGWYLSDSASNLREFRIPDGTIVRGGGFVKFEQFAAGGFGDTTDNNPGAFGLSERGDTLRLAAVDNSLIRENIDALHVLDDGSIIFSTTANAVLAGEGSTLLIGNGDLVRYNPATGTAVMFLSEKIFVGGNENIDALFVDERDGSVIFSTAGPAALAVPQLLGDPTLLEFDDGDLIRITPGAGTDLAAGRLGLAVVARVLSEDLFEVNPGETFVRENIDAVFIRDNGAFIISTTGPATLGTLVIDDGDLIEITAGNTSDLAAGVLGNATVRRIVSEAIFALNVGSTVPTENIDAVHFTFQEGQISSVVLSTVGSATLAGVIPPLQFTNADLVEITPGARANLSNGRLGAGASARLIFEENPADGSITFFGDVAGYRDTAKFGAAEREVTFGLHVTSDGTTDLVAQSRPTPRRPNALPKVGPVVFNEIMYNPLVGGDEAEYIELRNITDRDVPLFDPLFPVNTWKITGGVDFVFPVRITLRPGQLLLVTPTAPERFLENHSVPPEAIVVGPFSGRLANSGETIRLRKPASPDESAPLAMILVDEVSYNDTAPWPLEADGLGTALRRREIDQYGNDPINWENSLFGGTPGDLPVPPRVAAVILSGRQWSPAFVGYLADQGLGVGGFSIPSGADQLTTIPWSGVDMIRIRFSENVTIAVDDLELIGVNTPAQTFRRFRYDANQFLATWTLAGPLQADRVLLRLSDTIVDDVNLKLDGNWDNGNDQFPSGNGSIDAEDDFQFRLTVLPGDAAASGRIDRGDLLAILRRLSVDVDDDQYDPRLDLDADGRITLADLRSVLYRLGGQLPSGEPNVSTGSSAFIAIDEVFDRAGRGPINAEVGGAGGTESNAMRAARRARRAASPQSRNVAIGRHHALSPLSRLQASAVDRAIQDLPDAPRSARAARRRF